jgi:hypothetical protein
MRGENFISCQNRCGGVKYGYLCTVYATEILIGSTLSWKMSFLDPAPPFVIVVVATKQTTILYDG